jgi:hypothetical protein
LKFAHKFCCSIFGFWFRAARRFSRAPAHCPAPGWG